MPRDHFAGSGMRQLEPFGMQCLTIERNPAGAASCAVDRVADERMSDRVQVHAYLVRST